MIKLLIALILIPFILIVAAFSYKNAQSVNLDLFVQQINVPQSAIILVSVLTGLILGFIANLGVILALRYRIRRLEKQKQNKDSLTDILKNQ